MNSNVSDAGGGAAAADEVICTNKQWLLSIDMKKNVWKSDKSWEPEKIWKFENLENFKKFEI